MFEFDDYYRFRHILNGVIGAFIILFIGLFGRLFKNDKVGITAMIVAFSVALTCWVNHSIIPKIFPLLLGTLCLLYFMSKWFYIQTKWIKRPYYI
ncbi:MAG: hypothetical protein IPO98_07125 [Saprospiraceae bacterium]|nr:hypothetical protein [Saprospiraceae bacterium]